MERISYGGLWLIAGCIVDRASYCNASYAYDYRQASLEVYLTFVETHVLIFPDISTDRKSSDQTTI